MGKSTKSKEHSKQAQEGQHPPEWADGWPNGQQTGKEPEQLKAPSAATILPKWLDAYKTTVAGEWYAIPKQFDESCTISARNMVWRIQDEKYPLEGLTAQHIALIRNTLFDYGDVLIMHLLAFWGMLSCKEMMAGSLDDDGIVDQVIDMIKHAPDCDIAAGVSEVMRNYLFPRKLFTEKDLNESLKNTFIDDHFARTLHAINKYFPTLAKRLREHGLPPMSAEGLWLVHGFMCVVEACWAFGVNEELCEFRTKQLIYVVAARWSGSSLNVHPFTRLGIDQALTTNKFEFLDPGLKKSFESFQKRLAQMMLKTKKEILEWPNNQNARPHLVRAASTAPQRSTLGELVEPATPGIQNERPSRMSNADKAKARALRKEAEQKKRAAELNQMSNKKTSSGPSKTRKKKGRPKTANTANMSQPTFHSDDENSEDGTGAQDNSFDMKPLSHTLDVATGSHKKKPSKLDPTKFFEPMGLTQHTIPYLNSHPLEDAPFSNQLFQIDHTREHINQNHVPHYPLPDFTRISTVNRHIMLVLDSPPDPNHDINLYHVWSLGICRIVRQHNIRLDELVTLCVPALRTHHFELYPVYQLIGEFNILGEIIENITYQTKKHDEQYKNLVIRLPSDVFDKCIAQIFMKLNKNKFTVIFMFMDYIQIGDALTLLPDPFVTWKFGENDIRTPDYEYATFAEMTLEEVHTLRNWYKEQKAAYIRNQSQVDLPYIDKLTIPQLGG